MPLDQSNLAGALQAFRQQRQQGAGMAGFGQRFPRQNPNPGPLPPGMGGGQRFPQPRPAAGGGYDGSGINPGAGAPRVPGGFSMGGAMAPQPMPAPRQPPPSAPAPMTPGGGPSPLGGAASPVPAPSQNTGPLPPGMGSPVPRRVPQFQRPEAMAGAVPTNSNPILLSGPAAQPKAMAL